MWVATTRRVRTRCHLEMRNRKSLREGARASRTGVAVCAGLLVYCFVGLLFEVVSKN